MKNRNQTIIVVGFLSIILLTVIGYVMQKNTNTESNTLTKVEDTKSQMVSSSSSVQEDLTQSKEQNQGTPNKLETLTNEDWKKRLSADQYAVLRLGGTETPYTSDLVNEKRKGSYVTADCGELVFRSEQKFDSGTGWPSFYAPANNSAVTEKKDTTLGTARTEIISSGCSSHLGHVFNDAPQTPTGLRYCINGIALRFIPDKVQ